MGKAGLSEAYRKESHDKPTLEERFKKVYAILPEPEKDRVISVFGGRALTWREVSNMLNYSREALLQMDRVKVI